MEAADIKGLLGLLLIDGSLNQYRTPRGGYVQLTLTGGVTESAFLDEKVQEFRQFIPTKAEIVPYQTAARYLKRKNADGEIDDRPRHTTVLRFRVSTNKLRPVYNLLYPEGTRFTPGRRQRLIARLAEKGDAAGAARAAAFTHVLPPHPGGPVALLSHRRPGEDVVLCAHTGLEGILGLGAALDGRLVGCTIRLKVWHVPGEQVPREPDAALAWLDERWREVDAWVASEGAASVG